MPRPGRAAVGSLMVVTGAVGFGTLGPVSQLVYRAGLTPLGLATWRALIGGAALGLMAAPWMWRTGGSLVPRAVPARQRLALWLSVLAGVTLNLGLFSAFERLGIPLSLVVFYTYPALVALASAALGRERFGPLTVAALGLASIGLLLVLLVQLDPGTGLRVDPAGLVLALGSSLSQVAIVLLTRHAFPAVSPSQTAFVQLAGGAGGFVLIGLLSGPGALAGPLAIPSTWPLLLWAGAGAAAIPTVLFLTGIRWLGAVRTSILMLLEPVTGVLLAAFLLQQTLRPIQLAGGILVLVAGIVAQLRPGSSGTPEPAADSAPGPADATSRVY